MNYDNPAARLLSIIKQGQQIPSSSNCRESWQTLLDVSNNNPLLMSRLGKVMELPELTILALQENFPHQANTWSHWESQVNSAFMSQDLNGQWATFIGRIDGHSITYLQMSAELLQAKANTKPILGDEIGQLRESLNQILSAVMESETADEVKKYLARNIRKIIMSIDEYRLTGALPLLDSIESTLGHAHIDKNYMVFLKDTDLGKRLLDTLGAMANVVTVAVGLPQLSQAIALLTA